MVYLITLLFFLTAPSWGSVDMGVGSSSFTAGRPALALALGYDADTWGAMYRSVGVRTTIYAQNAWTLAAHPYKYKENIGPIEASVSGGLGAAYMLRSFRDSPSAANETTKETAIGPHLALKFRYGVFYFGFDTLLGLTPQVLQHLVLNFQDLSHVTIGISL